MRKRLSREEWRRAMEEASRDPLYLADIEEIERDFAYADAEAARMIDELGDFERAEGS